ncbi:unnamed protein product [Rotaria sp. Silwood1]|nr:unnamed protein product [Rotaria sp. Silwood1]CAF1656780.1 unnamed protein product [Rotaria sp. Silwood1]
MFSSNSVTRLAANSRQVDSVVNEQQPLTNSSEAPLHKNQTTLKRQLSLFSGTCFIIANIVGSGIFISPQGVLKYTESVGLCLVIWTACGIVSILGALCYAEIGTIIPLSGAELAYMTEGIGSVHARTGDVLAFLCSWAGIFILKPSGTAVVILAGTQYLLSGVINGYTQHLQSGFTGITKKPLAIALAFYSGLWAYDGWKSLNSLTEELKNPKRNLGLAIILALPTVTILYVLTNISYFTAMSPAVLLNSNAVAVTWAEMALHPFVRALPILIAISALGNGNAGILGSSRYCMVGARYGYLPEIFAYIQRQRLTPLPSIALQVLTFHEINSLKLLSFMYSLHI